MNVTIFRADFPEFADAAAFPDSTVNYWLTLAGKLLNVDRWADLLDNGLELFVAHNIVLERQAAASAATGATPGITTGAVSAKGVDKVTVSYDTSAGMDLEAGHWNLTHYGSRFIRLARMMGTGGLQL